jgi:hypothetical protein
MKKLLAVMFCAFLSSSAFAYSYSCFPMMSGKGTIALNPFAYGSAETKIASLDLIAAANVFNKLDIWANAGSISFSSDETMYNTWWVMPRLSLTKNNIVGIMANDIFTSLQYHGVWFENDQFFFQNNTGVDLVYEIPKDPTLWTILSPGVKIGKTGLDIYCDAGFSIFDSDFSLKIVPGIGATIKNSLFSFGVVINDVTNEPHVSVGMWWYHVFSYTK